jgi:tetratricopeptide (TPR) repeat protein
MSRSKKRRRAPAPGLAAVSEAPAATIAPRGTTALLFAIGLAAATIVAYAPVRTHEFVQIDDPAYVTENPHVLGGLTAEGVRWALTSNHAANWHPLTWISHMLDLELFGLDAGAHHLTNLAMHVASTLLLFGWLVRTTGAAGRSAFVAALFALHPLHVESVAWVAERKDVLSTLLLMLTLWAYLPYVRASARGGRSGRVRWLLVVAFVFALGLLAKPMLVTVPFLLLLLDAWPLGRVSLRGSRLDVWRPLVVEKLPLIALSALSSVLTFVAQQRGGAVAELTRVPLLLRLENAVVSYVAYLAKMIWPANLSVVYPLPEAIPIWQAALALIALAAITALVLRTARRQPYLAVGWLWYVGMLVPVIGIVQVGVQAFADRYTYVPLVGVFIMMAWGAVDVAARAGGRGRPVVLALPALAIVIICGVLTRQQVGYWRSSVPLWQHALSVTLGADRYDAHMELGRVLLPLGRRSEALEHYSAAVRLRPDSAEAHHQRGVLLLDEGRTADAIAAFREAVRLAPGSAASHANLGRAVASTGDSAAAIPHFQDAVRLDPSQPAALSDLGAALVNAGRPDEAIGHLTSALRLRADFPEAHNNLGFAFARTGRYEQALTHFSEALRLNPSFELARRNRILTLITLKRGDEALRDVRELLRLNPGDAWARDLLQSATGGGSSHH